MKLVDKVVAYIVRDGEILVFRHLDFPDAGIQVIAGTIEPDETPEAAVLRETFEESGLEKVSIVRYLGNLEYSMTPYREEIQRRHFFHLKLGGAALRTWRHDEKHPSTGGGPIALEYSWLSIPTASRVLAVGQGAMLSKLEPRQL